MGLNLLLTIPFPPAVRAQLLQRTALEKHVIYLSLVIDNAATAVLWVQVRLKDTPLPLWQLLGSCKVSGCCNSAQRQQYQEQPTPVAASQMLDAGAIPSKKTCLSSSIPPPSQESKTELGKWPLQGFAKAADRCCESVRIFVPATTSVHVLIYSWACKDLAAFTCKFTGQMSLQCLYSLSSCFQKGQRSCARCKRSTT